MTYKSNIVMIYGYEFVFTANSQTVNGNNWREKVLVYALKESDALQVLKDNGYQNIEMVSKNPYPNSSVPTINTERSYENSQILRDFRDERISE